MTRDELADLFLTSEFNCDSLDSRPNFNSAACSKAEYVAHVRNSKPFSLAHAYRMADWAIQAMTTQSASTKPYSDQGEVIALRSALRNLLDACYQADGAENLSEEIDGRLLDAASEALELQYPIIWTDEQVAMLEKRQADSSLHPYTCGGDRTDRAHRWHADESGEEAGLLYPTVRGWKCPACDYRQFWSHETGDRLPTISETGA